MTLRSRTKALYGRARNIGAKVDFFIVGVQKGGTTALDRVLRDSPGVQMPDRKEIHFFDDERRDWSKPDYRDLHRRFDWTVAGVRRGEATPIYSYWPGALERLADYNPDARIVLSLRHPAFRAHSHWRMEAKRGDETLSFGAAIRGGRERVGARHRVFSYVERGFYAPQIRRIQALFDRVHVIRCDRMWSDFRPTLRGLCAFLGAPSHPRERRYVAPVETRSMAPIRREDLDHLSDLYAEDIRETAALTGLDLDDRLDRDYAEPMPR